MNAPRLIDDMETEVKRLSGLAAGFKLAGEAHLAFRHRSAAQVLRHAALLLKDLPK